MVVESGKVVQHLRIYIYIVVEESKNDTYAYTGEEREFSREEHFSTVKM